MRKLGSVPDFPPFEGYNRKTESTTKQDSTSTTKTYSYDETDWLTQIIDGTKTIDYSYDNNGNTIKKADSSAPGNDIVSEYDARDKLTKTSKGATTLGTYIYNANGYRIRQLGSDRGDVEYLYDGTAVIEERNNAGLLAHYRYAGKLYSLFDGANSQYYHQDALGSTVDLTDDTGATKASYFLNPWGMIVDSIGSSVNRRVFTGKEIDQNTGLVYFGARYYDPDTARFTTQDSYLGEQGTPPSLHRYLYAYSNPTVYVDLEGYESIFSKGADFLHGLVKDSKDYISNLNKKADKGIVDRGIAALIGIGNVPIEIAAGAADLADLSTDVSLAINPATQGTEVGEKARKRVQETTTKVALTAKRAYEYVTTEDPAAMAQTAKETIGNYLEKTFIEGDLNYTADFSGKAFGATLAGASVRAAQMGKAAGAVDAIEETAISRGQYLREKYCNLSQEKRMQKIDELSKANYEHVLEEKINSGEYVYRYLSEKGLAESMQNGTIRGYSTTEFSAFSEDVARGSQIKSSWGVPRYGVAIPVDELRGFSLARPFGNSATSGWEIFTNSYPEAGPGKFTQFLLNPVPIEKTHIFSLKPIFK